MKATITKPMILKAAATLANGGYNNSALQFVRHGDKMEICGTNNYVAVIATIDAKFTRWPDGEGFRFNGSEVQALMRGSSKALKNTDSIVIEIAGGSAVVTLKVDDAAVSTSFPYATEKRPINLAKIFESIKEGPDGNIKDVSAYFMGLSTNAMRTISDGKYGAWTFKEHGLSNPMEFISKMEQARVLVMPSAN